MINKAACINSNNQMGNIRAIHKEIQMSYKHSEKYLFCGYTSNHKNVSRMMYYFCLCSWQELKNDVLVLARICK